MKCIVCNKTKYTNYNHLVHKFPSNLETRLKWLTQVRKPLCLAEGNILANYGVCSMHFKDESYSILSGQNKRPRRKRSLRHGSMPTLDSIYIRKWPQIPKEPKIAKKTLEELPLDCSNKYLALHAYSKRPEIPINLSTKDNGANSSNERALQTIKYFYFTNPLFMNVPPQPGPGAKTSMAQTGANISMAQIDPNVDVAMAQTVANTSMAQTDVNRNQYVFIAPVTFG